MDNNEKSGSNLVFSWDSNKQHCENICLEDSLFEDTVKSIGESKVALDQIGDEGGRPKSARFVRRDAKKT